MEQLQQAEQLRALAVESYEDDPQSQLWRGLRWAAHLLEQGLASSPADFRAEAQQLQESDLYLSAGLCAAADYLEHEQPAA